MNSYAEGWFGGVERELWPRVSVKAQYIRRNVGNTIGFIDTGSVSLPASVVDPGPDGAMQTPDDGGPLTIDYRDSSSTSALLMTNPAGAWRRDGEVDSAQRAARGVTSASTSLSTHLIASTIIVCISGLSQLASTWPSVE